MRGWLLVLTLAACHAKTVRHEFYEAAFEMPAGASWANSGYSLPEPDETVVRPGIQVYVPNEKRLDVEIKKLPDRTSLAAMKAELAARPEVTAFAGTPTATGWDASYRWTANGTASVIHLHLVSLPDADYECQYDDANSPDRAAAEAICASLAAK